MWDSEAADEILLTEIIDAILHSYPAVCLTQAGRRKTDMANAPMRRCRHQSDHIEQCTAPNSDQTRVTTQLGGFHFRIELAQILEIIL